MDEIRKALGEDHIAFYGGSYGSYLGAVYATLFPRSKDRILLDSNVDPDWIWYKASLAQAAARQGRFEDLTKYLAANDATYHLGTTASDVAQLYADLTSQLDMAPVTVPAGTPSALPGSTVSPLPPGSFLNGDGLRKLTADMLILDRFFPIVGWALQTVHQGGLQAGTPPDPNAEIDPVADNGATGYIGITCTDAAWPRSVEAYASDVAHFSTLFPFAGANGANIGPCAYFPPPTVPPVSITSDGPSNILMVQSRHDPETPYDGALALRAMLGRRAAMVVDDEGGHGLYLIQGNSCLNGYATTFLLDGTLPSADVECAAPPAAAH
jgi:hypothetical protein